MTEYHLLERHLNDCNDCGSNGVLFCAIAQALIRPPPELEDHYAIQTEPVTRAVLLTPSERTLLAEGARLVAAREESRAKQLHSRGLVPQANNHRATVDSCVALVRRLR